VHRCSHIYNRYRYLLHKNTTSGDSVTVITSDIWCLHGKIIIILPGFALKDIVEPDHLHSKSIKRDYKYGKRIKEKRKNTTI